MPDWIRSDAPVPYPEATGAMEARVDGILAGREKEAVWLLEHPPLYTAGASSRPSGLLDGRLPVFETRRGGQHTYHGPGQRVAYVMLDLRRRRRDVRAFVRAMEGWAVAALAELGVTGQVREGRVGVWVERPDKPPLPDGTPREDKIAAIGIRIRRWVSFHGISVNQEPDLSHYAGIVPCGIEGHGVTSLADLGITATMDDLDMALAATFAPALESHGLAMPSPQMRAR